jgi:hypothetical protein
MALISSVGDSHTSAKTLDDIRGSSAVYSSPENPELKESSFPLDDAIRINQVGMQPSQAQETQEVNCHFANEDQEN